MLSGKYSILFTICKMMIVLITLVGDTVEFYIAKKFYTTGFTYDLTNIVSSKEKQCNT